MGLLNGMLGKSDSSNPLGSLLGGLGSAGGNSNLIAIAMSLFERHGGLSGVLDLFRSKGLGQQAESWVSTGPNMDISGEQLEQVFGGGTFENIAAQLGMSQGDARNSMAQALPALVDRLTPDGKVPDNENDLISRGLAMLRGGEA